MAVVFFCVVAVFCVTVERGQIVLGYQKHRPFQVGTSREHRAKPLISSIKHWSSNADDNASFGIISTIHNIDNIPLITKKKSEHGVQLINEFQNSTTSKYEDWNPSKPNTLLKSIVTLELPAPNSPPFAGGETPSQIIPPDKPWPARPEDHEELSFTPPKPHLIDRCEETTKMILNEESNSITNQIMGSTRSPKFPKPNNPSVEGQIGGGISPQTIQPEEPWTSRPEDNREFNAMPPKPQVADSSKEITKGRIQLDSDSMPNQIIGSGIPTKLPNTSKLSSAGQTIQPGVPWPSRPEDYVEFNSTLLKSQLGDIFRETTTLGLQTNGDSVPNRIIGSSGSSKLPKPSRPFFAGQTGGGIPSQIIPPGKPWPSRPEEYAEFSATSSKPQIVDRFKETTTIRLEADGDSIPNQIMGSNRPPKWPKPSRPSFAGQTGGGIPSQIIPPGKPWPSRPEEYAEFSATSSKPQIVDRFKETTTIRPEVDGDSIPNQIIGSNRPSNFPKPSRPSFAGQTGGGIPSQIIPPGKPWPSSPEEYEEFISTSSKPQIVDRFKETTTIRLEGDGDSLPNQIMESSTPPKLPKPNRPSFAGQTGGGRPPQIIPPGKPWPARPEEYVEFSTTSSKPQIVDRFKETTTIRPEEDGDSIPNQIIGSSRPSNFPKPSRPSFAGQTGGGTPPQIIPPGKPWPSRPEDYAEFSATSSKPQIGDRFKETTTMRLEGDGDSMSSQIVESSRPPKLPKPSRPSFAGQTGGGTPPQIIPPGEPWPARPEDYLGFHFITYKPQLLDTFKETTTNRLQEGNILIPNKIMEFSSPSTLPAPSRPSFAGLTGIGPPSQIFPPGKPWPTRPEDFEGFSVTSRMPQLAKETTKLQKVNISDTVLKPIAPPLKVLSSVSQGNIQSTKPWSTKQAEEMMTKIKDEVFLSKIVSNSKPARPQVNNLLLLDSPFFRQIFKSSNPWHVSQKMYEESTPVLLSFRPEENPFTSAPTKKFLGRKIV